MYTCACWRKGGIKSTNALRTLYGTVSITGHAFDGVAVVSDIVTSRDPRAASNTLAEIVQVFKSAQTSQVDSALAGAGRLYAVENILDGVGIILGTVRERSPLVHQVHLFAITHLLNLKEPPFVRIDNQHSCSDAVRKRNPCFGCKSHHV